MKTKIIYFNHKILVTTLQETFFTKQIQVTALQGRVLPRKYRRVVKCKCILPEFLFDTSFTSAFTAVQIRMVKNTESFIFHRLIQALQQMHRKFRK